MIGRTAAARTPVACRPTFSTPMRLPFSDNQPQLWTAECSGAAAATGRSLTCNANFFNTNGVAAGGCNAWQCGGQRVCCTCSAADAAACTSMTRSSHFFDATSVARVTTVTQPTARVGNGGPRGAGWTGCTQSEGAGAFGREMPHLTLHERDNLCGHARAHEGHQPCPSSQERRGVSRD